MDLHQRIRALRRFVRMEEFMPVSPAEYLAERDRWIPAIQAFYEQREPQANPPHERSLIVVQMYRRQPWPWIRDLLEQVDVELLQRQPQLVSLDALEFYDDQPYSRDWGNGSFPTYWAESGDSARVGLTRAALDLDLPDRVPMLIGNWSFSPHILKTLIHCADPDETASVSAALAAAGIPRRQQMAALYGGSLLSYVDQRHSGPSTARHQLLSITQAGVGETAEMAEWLSRRAVYEEKCGFQGSSHTGRIPFELTVEIRDLLKQRLALHATPAFPAWVAP